MSIALDSSVTLAWALDDETTDPVRRVFEVVASEGAFAPSLWRLEVANSLTVAVRRRRIDADIRRAVLEDLDQLEILIDRHTDEQAWRSTLDLADRFRLTVYDAAYVELAQRRSLPLATLDQDMQKAARALGLTVLGE